MFLRSRLVDWAGYLQSCKKPVNLAILTIWSVFNPLAVPAPHRLSLFLAHQPSPHWKSSHSDMHHPVSGINSLIHSVSLASHVSTHLLIHLSAHLCHHHHFQHLSLLHSFTPGSKPTFSTFSTNPSHLNTPSTWTAFTITWPDRTYHASRFIFSSFFCNFSVCPVWWTKLATRQFFYWTLNTQCRIESYRIVSYRIVSYIIRQLVGVRWTVSVSIQKNVVKRIVHIVLRTPWALW